MKIRFHPHATQRMRERGATCAEVSDTIRAEDRAGHSAAASLAVAHPAPRRWRSSRRETACIACVITTRQPDRQAKPPGVTEMQLMVVIANGPTRDPRNKQRLLIQTRHVFDVRFERQDTGKTATYFGRWVTRRGLTGPWSARVAGTILFAPARRAE